MENIICDICGEEIKERIASLYEYFDGAFYRLNDRKEKVAVHVFCVEHPHLWSRIRALEARLNKIDGSHNGSDNGSDMK